MINQKISTQEIEAIRNDSYAKLLVNYLLIKQQNLEKIRDNFSLLQ